MAYRNWCVELHIATDVPRVFTRELKEESVARRWFDETALAIAKGDGSPAYEVRLWHGMKMVDRFSIRD